MDPKLVHRAYVYTFSSPQGTQVLHDLQKAHYVLGPMTGPNIDPYALAYNEGQRNVVLRIMEILESKEEDYEQRDNHADGLGNGNRFDRESINAAADQLYTASAYKPKSSPDI